MYTNIEINIKDALEGFLARPHLNNDDIKDLMDLLVSGIPKHERDKVIIAFGEAHLSSGSLFLLQGD